MSTPSEPNRYDVERWVERSKLPRLACDILFFLARRMLQGSLIIPMQHTPSLSTIAAATKWSRRHIQRGLNYLEELGLIVRSRPSRHDARVKHARTAYAVVWPALQELGTASPPPPRAKKSQGLGTGRRQPRDRQPPELGTGSPEARDTRAHSQTLSDQPDQSDHGDLVDVAIKQLLERTGVEVSREWAAETVQQICSRPGIKNRRAYLIRTLATDKNPQRWLPTQQPPSFTGGKHEAPAP